MDGKSGKDNQGCSLDTLDYGATALGNPLGNDIDISDSLSDVGKVQKQQINQPLRKFKRTIIIEPSFALFFMFHISSYPLSSQFLYFAIGEKYNLSTLLEGASDNDTDTGPCGTGDRNSSLYLLQQKVQAETSSFNLYLDLVTGIPAVLAVMFYGTVTDKLGRKPGLIIPIIGVMVKAFSYMFVQLLNLPLEVVFLGHIVEALTGGIGAFMTACYAFYADTVTKENLGRRLAISDVAFGFSLAGMEVFMGFFITATGFMWPFVIVISGHMINLVYTIFFVPETVDKEKQNKPLSPKYFIESFKVLPKKRPNNGRFLLLFYIVFWMVCGFGTSSRYGLQQLYKLNSPFCWSASFIGMFNGLQSLLVNIVQVIAALLLMKRLGEVIVVQISLTSFIVAYILEGLSTTDWMLVIVPFVGCFMGLQLPVMRAILSGLVPNEEQGAVFSVVSATDRILGMAASAFYNPIYSATIYSFKGTIFMIMAGFILISMVLLGIFGTMQKREKQQQKMKRDTWNDTSPMVWSTKM